MLPEVAATPFSSLVRQWKKLTIQEWSDDDYELLTNSPTRIDDNQVAHLDIKES